MTRKGIVFMVAVALLCIFPASAAMGAGDFVVGILCLSPTMEPAVQGFMAELSELASHAADATITYIYNGPVVSIAGLADEVESLIATGIDVLFTLSTPASLAAKAATELSQIPVVFTVVADAVATGIVDSLTSPGGNITGVQVGGSIGKELEWLLTIAPDVHSIFVPHNPLDGGSVTGIEELRPAADALDIELLIQEVTTADELLDALANVPEAADALFLNSSGFLNAQIETYVAVALSLRLPLASVCACIDSGVLLSYGHDYTRDGQQAARLVHQILHGVPPADMPVETADFFLGINLATAEAIGLFITDEVLDQVDYIAR